MTLSEVSDIKGELGNFKVDIIKHPRYIDESKCIACGLCAEKCPKKVADAYNMGLTQKLSNHVHFGIELTESAVWTKTNREDTKVFFNFSMSALFRISF